ncbi:putative aldouronate transport system permease protein [Paenibacillus sp. UNCCL117]|uniref:ABC transporter permease n=1 Tax=unclassified Paenibacillus TaxID=185978 RepID=UPI00088E69A7|nr:MULTISPECIES: sugar ABC transporter permease [unclassified Paenibacillus]SDE37923.1 putative aldouronate transport system permease protein [Paenibacillus sp. cl123]SFW65015.1 putative aldouronate transport system permease protein [Paenibacillus sp. UNCCL117]
MKQTVAHAAAERAVGSVANQFLKEVRRHKWLYLMVLPGILYFAVFKYVPMLGIAIAFKDYQPFAGFLDSPWVGLKHFERFFSNDDFPILLRNTLIIAIYKLLFYFPVPIVLALLLNEVRIKLFKRVVQTILYVPHFFSWLVIVGMTYMLLTTEGGLINQMVQSAGAEPINFLGTETWIRTLLTSQNIWKEAGWGTILYLASMSAIDPQLYEAARMDGAGRFRLMWHITLPCIRSTIVILLILQLGHMLDLGFEQIFNMLNPGNRLYAEVFDTYVYTAGITQGQFSYSTAVGLFKSLVGLVLVLLANAAARRLGEEGVF